jgi:NAD(P)-dependent dehydrogenase (short-subunit alcohol dehydrogenase family)
LVRIVSTAGLIGNIGQGNYAAAKMAMVGLSRTIANEMVKYRVRSNCIAPFA